MSLPNDDVEVNEKPVVDEDMTPTHYEREDNRWMHHSKWRDWVILLVMIIVYLLWAGVVYFLEPGIR